MIFIVNGKGGVGKDEFKKMVAEIAEKDQTLATIHSTIDWIKDIATIFGWNGGKTLKDRKMLCDLKDLLTNYNDSPYQHICQVLKIENQYTPIIFVDCREPKEIERFVKDWNAITILIERNTINKYGNHADDDVNNYNYDITIDNNGSLSDLYQKALSFYRQYINPNYI